MVFIYNRTENVEYECINRTILYGNVMNMPLIIIEINYSDIDSDDSSYYY